MPHAPLTAVQRRLPENWVSTVAILTRPAHGVVFNAMGERKTDCEFCRADYFMAIQGKMPQREGAAKVGTAKARAC